MTMARHYLPAVAVCHVRVHWSLQVRVHVVVIVVVLLRIILVVVGAQVVNY